MSNDGWASASQSGGESNWSSPPPPPSGAVPPPPSSAIPPPPPAPVWSSLSMNPVTGERPPRPRVKVAGWLMTIGSLVVIAGGILPWASGGGESFGGLDTWYQINERTDGIGTELYRMENPGVMLIIGGVILAGLAITILAAGRVLAVAIIGIVLASIGTLIAIGMTALVAMGQSIGSEAFEQAAEHSIGVGPPLGILGTLAVLAGSIVATATRRR